MLDGYEGIDRRINLALHNDTALGIFLSPDPIGPRGGLNEYGYALGNPSNLTDRSGLVGDGDGTNGRVCMPGGSFTLAGGGSSDKSTTVDHQQWTITICTSLPRGSNPFPGYLMSPFAPALEDWRESMREWRRSQRQQQQQLPPEPPGVVGCQSDDCPAPVPPPPPGGNGGGRGGTRAGSSGEDYGACVQGCVTKNLSLVADPKTYSYILWGSAAVPAVANAKVSLDIATLFEEGVIDARTLLEAQELGITTVEVPAGEYGASFAADGVSSFLGLSDGAAVGLGSWLGRGARYGAQGAAVAGVGLASFALGSVGYCGVTCAGGP